MTPKSGRVIAWLTFTLGIAVSVAGNILHSAITPAGLGELAGAAFWPLALMLSIEILTRVHWRPGKRWMAARVVGLVLVGIVAAVLSYRHLAGLMTSWGEDRFNAHLGPLAVDGLMLLAATALLSISHEKLQAASTAGLLLTADPEPQTSAERRTTFSPRPLPPRSAGVNPSGPETVAEAEPQRLHIVDRVSTSVAEEAALQAWIDSGRSLSTSQLGELMGVSKSTAARRAREWRQDQRRIVR